MGDYYNAENPHLNFLHLKTSEYHCRDVHSQLRETGRETQKNLLFDFSSYFLCDFSDWRKTSRGTSAGIYPEVV